MAELKIEGIRCNQTEDSGEDEILLKINDTPIYMGDVNEPNYYPIGTVVSFNDRVDVSLYERDSGWWGLDSTDHLATVVIEEADGDGRDEKSLVGDGADYTLSYEVRGVSGSTTAPYGLILTNLKCITTEDSSAHDEAYLKIIGISGRNIVWGPLPIGENEEKPIGMAEEDAIPFETNVVIELWDEDTGIFDWDDFIDEVRIWGSIDAGRGERVASLQGDDAAYELTYRVNSD